MLLTQVSDKWEVVQKLLCRANEVVKPLLSRRRLQNRPMICVYKGLNRQRDQTT